MKLSSVTLINFRCFGPATQTIPLDEGLAALLGSNGAGKSSVLASLSKVFGLGSAERSLLRSDFHLPPGKSWDTVGPVDMVIELRFELPELVAPAKSAGAPAAMFKHLAVIEAGKPPACRARLKAKWSPSTLAEGDIDQELVWVLAPGKDGVERCQTISAADRAAIVVHYIPATRDPIRHIRQSAGSILHGFLRAISWSAATKTAVQTASESIRDSIGGEAGMKTINGLVESCWQELHKEGTHSKVIIQPVAKRIEDLIAQVDTVFQPAAGDAEEGVDRLSDGQRSLFYIALVAMSFDVQARLRKDNKHGLEEDKVRSPVLTILAVEEPENHVSPHYLGRIVTLLKRIANDPAGQVVLTSHSASIMARVEPECVRHLSFDGKTKLSTVRHIELPPKGSDREKFVREAVKAYPELYFAKLVVLGEGDSEELVMPRLARALGGIELDTSLISFVPLGGRHVNHFWRLLNGLGYPYLTLLDLDLGRAGGGWGRVKYALDQLLELGVDEAKLLNPIGKKGLAAMHTWDGAVLSTDMASWIALLEGYRVFFSSPLDLDFSMLRAFPVAYQKLEAGETGPQKSGDEALVTAVLAEKSTAGPYFTALGAHSLLWYRYLFLGRGKPATHALALGRIKDNELVKETPAELKRFVDSIASEINPDYFAFSSMTRLQERQSAWMPAGITLEPAARTAAKSQGHSLVIAGPGAGKTELLAQRASYLLQTRSCPPPYRILAISFKREAAENLKARVILRCGRELAGRLDSLTFDAFAKDLVDRFRLGLPPDLPSADYDIVTGADVGDERMRQRMTQLSLEHCPLTTAQRQQIIAAQLRSGFIGRRLPFADWPKAPHFVAGAGLWRGLLGQAPSQLTFLMVNRLAEFLVRSDPTLRAALRDTYRYVFLDEFQDTTTGQCELVETCFHGSSSILTAVGDSKQRIMGWAGALPGIFQRFRDTFSAAVVCLTQNHRSRSRLVEIQSVFAAKLDPEAVEAVTARDGEETGECRVLEFPNEPGEAQHLAGIISGLIAAGVPPEEICVLCRARPEQFAASLIGQLKAGGLKVRVEVNRRETLGEPVAALLLDMIALVFSESAPEAWEHVSAVVSELAGDNDENSAMRTRKRLLAFLAAQKSNVDATDGSKEQVQAALATLLEFAGRERFAAIHPQYAQGQYMEDVMARLAELIAMELPESGWEGVVGATRGVGAVSVMTMHKSKGLEFDTVIFLGLEDSAIWNFADNSNEETCGLFVALSRAKERCYFTYCRSRINRWGKAQPQSRITIARVYELFEASGVHVEMIN